MSNINVSLLRYLYSSDLGDESCYPDLKFDAHDSPFVKVVQGRHPVVIAASPDVAFIPNDFDIDKTLSILTGANMGGKSTL